MAGIEQGFYEEQNSPRWAGDWTGRHAQIPGGAQVEPGLFAAANNVTVQLNDAGNAASGDSTLTVDAVDLSAFDPRQQEIKPGTRLQFSGGTVAVVKELVEDGDTEIEVYPLAGAIADDETAVFVHPGPITVKSGAPLGRTRTERDAGLGYGPAATGDEEFYLALFPVDDVVENPEVELYRHGSLVYTNLLPEFDGLHADVKALIYANYECSIMEETGE